MAEKIRKTVQNKNTAIVSTLYHVLLMQGMMVDLQPWWME